jgi:hypothetical protein
MQRKAVLTAVAAVTAVAIVATDPAALVAAPPPPAFVTTRGREFIGPDGQPLLLRGINLGNWLLPEGYMFKFKTAASPRLIHTLINQLVGEDEARRFWTTYRNRYITSADIAFIKKSGFNSVRVPFSYRLFVSEADPARLEGPGYQLLDRLVGWCRDAGLFVILDMHAAPGGQTGDNIDDSWGFPFLYDNPESQALTIRIWQKIAAKYRDEPAVAGYDLLNEPIAHYFDTASLNGKLEPLYRKIVAGIREIDRNHVIFLGGARWDTDFSVFGPPFDDKLAYTFHKYWMDVKPEAIREYVDFSRKHNVPVWMGESGENTDGWIASFRTLLEQNGIGWCFWPYKKLDATSSAVSINMPPGWDAIMAFAERPRVLFQEVRETRPAKDTIATALAGYLRNIEFSNCRVNSSYLKALGLP